MHYPGPAAVREVPADADGVVPLKGFSAKFYFDPEMNGDDIKDQVASPP